MNNLYRLITKVLWFTIISTSINSVVYAQEIPLGRDGTFFGAVFNGNQNMPATLHGVAIEWSRDCNRGRADDCMTLADAFEKGTGDLVSDIRIALGYYLKACEHGEGKGCTRATTIIRGGDASFINEQLAQETAAKGCEENNDQNSCALMAEGLAPNGNIFQSNEATALIEKSCAEGSDYGCQIKATNLFYEKDDFTSQQQAIEMFSETCDDGIAWGCAELANAYIKGRGKPRDIPKATEFAKEGCLEAEGDTISACAIYGELLSGTGLKADLDLGVKLLAKSCTAGHTAACNANGNNGFLKSNSGVHAWEVPLYFREACDLGHADACKNLGLLYEHGFDKVEVNPSVMFMLFDRSCELGSAQGCKKTEQYESVRAMLKFTAPAVDPTLPALEQVSQATRLADQGEHYHAGVTIGRLMYEGVAEAQYVLGGWMYYGKPGIIDVPNKKDGTILFDNAARQGHIEAAKWMGMALWYGTGMDVNQQLGQNYMAIAASQGDEEAIQIYRSMLNEPARQDFARRQREMELEAERRKNDFWYQFSLAVSQRATINSYQPSGLNPSQQMARDSWRRGQQALDSLQFNNAVGYLTGRTSACPVSNPYC